MHKLLTLLAALALALSQAHADTPRTGIFVEAGKSVCTMKPLWRDFAEGSESADADYLAGTVKWMRPLHPRLVRTDSVFNAFSTVEVDKSGKLITDFSKLDKWIDTCKSMRAMPLICIAYLPKALTQPSGKGIEPPSDMKLWEELVYQLVKHVNIDRKYGVEYWEVWNEPNLGMFWTGTREQYLELYAATVKAALRADPSIKIGGGGIAGSDGNWIKAIIGYAKANNLRLDFVSWHDYNVPPQFYKACARRVQGWLDDAGLKSELLITEWNFDAGLHPGNDNEQAAAHAARSLHHMIDSPLDYSQFFEVKDGWKNNQTYWGRWGMITSDHHPKAVYYTYDAFSRLGTDRLKLTGGTTAVNGIAAKKGSQTQVLLYNAGQEADRFGSKGPVTLDLTIDNLPSGKLAWSRYLIDKDHSNPVREKRDSYLQKVQECVVEPSKGSLNTSITLERDSVSLITLEPAGNQAAKTTKLEALPPVKKDYRTALAKATRCPHADEPIVIDGRLNEWTHPAAYVYSNDDAALIRFAWDENGLYVAVAVKDKEQVQQQVGSEIWNGDSIQIGFDTLFDALPGEMYNTDDYEYGFALTAKGPLVWRWECPGWRSTGRIDSVKLAVNRDNGSSLTTYEAMILWSELDPLQPAAGKLFAASVVVNDVNTGKDRQTLEWGGGIPGIKQPALFKPVVFGE